jgi:hypothetical protein
LFTFWLNGAWTWEEVMKFKDVLYKVVYPFYSNGGMDSYILDVDVLVENH